MFDNLAIADISFIESVREFLFGDYKFYLVFAIFGSLIAFIQLCISFFFGGGDMDVNGDGEVSFGEHMDTGIGDFKLFSVRSLVSFFAFFGWGGVIAYDHGVKGLAAFFIAMASGSFMMFLTAIIFYLVMKMQHSGNITGDEYIGCAGTVYLRIPGGRAEIGKVTATVKGTSQEIVAVADEDIDRGVAVRIVEKVGNRRFLVEKV
ncbi:MAG: hypothetical protein GXP32_01565 [Kiritimatiellaeota bacterium]|nr:hypothetical protein [Kiritimatiellota bacterium]